MRRRDDKADQIVKLYLSPYLNSFKFLVRKKPLSSGSPDRALGSSETSVFRLLKGTHLLCSPFLWILASGGYLNVNGRLPLLGVLLLARVASLGLPYTAWSRIYSLYACGIEPCF